MRPPTLALWLACALPAAAAAGDAGATPAGQGAAAYTEDDLFRFLEDEIEVTSASLLKSKLTEVPQAVYVITRDEIERLPALNLADLLRHMPGVLVGTAAPSQWSVGVYGEVMPLYTSFVLIMVDGRTVASVFGSVIETWQIPYAPADIERIEVVLGPSCAAHGSQAIYGVINFITRRAGEPGAEVRLVTGGTYGADRAARFGDLLAHAQGTLHLGPVRLRAAGGYERLGPWDDAPFYRDGRLTPQPAGQRVLGNLRVEAEPGPDSSLVVTAAGAGYEGPFVSFGPGLSQGFEGHVDAELQVRRLLAEDDQLSLRAYLRYRSQFIEIPYDGLLPTVPFSMNEEVALARVLYTAVLPAHNRLVTALEARLESSDLEWIAPAGRTYGYFAAFLQDEARPIEPLIFNAGLRLETQFRPGLDFTSHLTATPQVSAVWLPAKGHGLRLTYGQAMFFAPGFFELGDVRTHGGRLLAYQGDPTVVRSPMHVWEAGYRGQIASSLAVTVSYAFRFVPSIIWFAPAGEGTLPLKLALFPGSESRHTLDATLSFRPSSVLRTDLTVTWILGVDRPAVYQARSSDIPPWRISGKLHLAPHDDVRFDIEAHAVAPTVARAALSGAETAIAGWVYVNVMLAYTFVHEPRLEIFGLATNLTDTKLGEGIHAEMATPGVSPVGRRFMLGLGLEL